MHRGNMRRGLCPSGWEGFGMLVGPSAPLPDIGELVVTGVCPTCRATAALSAVGCTLWDCGRALGKCPGPL